MKKTVLLIFVMCICLSVFSAEGLSFEVVNQIPLFREPIADPYSYNTHVNVVLDSKNNSPHYLRTLVTDSENNYSYLDIPYTEGKDDLFVNMKLAGSVNALHVTFDNGTLPKLEFELNLAGSINTLFTLSGGTETLDFDGSYFAGGTVRVADMVSVRFGIHHFSAHWGDETMESFFDKYKISGKDSTFDYDEETYTYKGLIEYVRDNSWLIGVSADLPYGFRTYAELEAPQNPSWLRPFVHTPENYKNSGDDKNNNTGSYRTARVEGCDDDATIANEIALKANSGYSALRVHGGVEWRYRVGNGTLVLAADVQAHQDGQTKHQINSFSKNNPWEFEYTVGASYEFADILSGLKTFSLDVFYHQGRTPATQFFYRSGNFVYIGIGIR